MDHQVLEGFYLNGAVVYIDDTVIYGRDEKILEMLDMVHGRMAQFNFSLNPSKCSFVITSVEFWWHIFDEHGMNLSDKRVRSVQDISIPTSVSVVHSFVGMVN